MDVKILHWKATSTVDEEGKETPNKNRYEITKNEAEQSVKIKYTIPFRNQERSGEVDIDGTVFGKCYDIFVTETSDYAPLVLPALEMCDNVNSYNTNGIDRQKVARAVVDDQGTILIALVSNAGKFDGVENIEMVYGEHPMTYYLMQESAWFKELVRKTQIKSGLIKNTDVYRSVSYLEAQVDVLTKLVLALAADKDLDGYSLLEEAAKYSVLNIKPTSAVMQEFSENKKHMRELQEAYYEKLS
jgi:hypothetical protein